VHQRPSSLRRGLLLAALLPLAAGAFAQNLNKPDQVDRIELEPGSARIRLLVVLGEDRVNTRQAVKALYSKFNRYQDFIVSGQARTAAPAGSVTLRPVVVLVGPRDATGGEMQNLDGLKLAAAKAGAAVEVISHVPALAFKPVAIVRVPPRNGP
jgi:hypothetical protein